jgi:Flp pilus assembly protein TadD
MSQALEKLEGRSRPMRWSRLTTWRLLDTDRLIAIEMARMSSTQFVSTLSKTMKVRGRKRGELAATIDRSRKLLLSGRHQENLDLLEESIQRFPKDPDIRLLYATVLLEFRPDQVAVEAAKAAEFGSENPRILVRAAQLLFDRGEIESAKSCVTRANELAPPDFVLTAGLINLNGLIAAYDGELELAEEKLRSALNSQPGDGLFAVDLARFLAARDRQEEAIETIDQALTRTNDTERLERVRSEILRSD